MELLLATVFLGLCVGGMLSSISGARDRASIARWDLISLALAESEISNVRSEAMRNVLTTGKTETTSNVTGMTMPVKVTREVTQVGSTDIYQVAVTVSYDRSVSTRTVSDGAKLTTMVRMPDV